MPRQNFTTAAIALSSSRDAIYKWLTNINEQRLPFDRVIIVPWGADRDSVIKIASKFIGTEVVSPGENTGIASNRNAALAHLSKLPTTYVAFLDDDTMISRDWNSEMVAAAHRFPTRSCFASLVYFEKEKKLVQSCGHIFPNGRPRDFLYKSNAEVITITREPMFPCMNSAYVPWSSLQEMSSVDNEYFDPLFERMTCFDLGLKLRLLGYECRLISGARATHTGYLESDDITERRVLVELRSRLCLYDKFLPETERRQAHKVLHENIRRWEMEGYPHSRIFGQTLRSLFAEAIEYANEIGLNTCWKDLAAALPDSSRQAILFGTLSESPV